MDSDAFRLWLHRAADWGADLSGRVREYPVRAQDYSRGDRERNPGSRHPRTGEPTGSDL